jgi:hypothetical protein
MSSYIGAQEMVSVKNWGGSPVLREKESSRLRTRQSEALVGGQREENLPNYLDVQLDVIAEAFKATAEADHPSETGHVGPRGGIVAL